MAIEQGSQQTQMEAQRAILQDNASQNPVSHDVPNPAEVKPQDNGFLSRLTRGLDLIAASGDKIQSTNVSRRSVLAVGAAGASAAFLAACGGGGNAEGSPPPKTDSGPIISVTPAVGKPDLAPATPEALQYPVDSFRNPAPKINFNMGVNETFVELDALDKAGLTDKLVGNQYNRLGVLLVPEVVMPDRNASGIVFNFKRPNTAALYGKNHNMDMIGQHLSWWSSPNYQTGWAKQLRTKADADAAWMQAVDAYLGNYPFITKWTVNEYGSGHGVKGRVDVMKELSGDDYIFRLAEYAKKRNSNLKIYYSDTYNETINPNSDADLALCQEGVARGVFDGMMFQGHFLLGSKDVPTQDGMTRNLARFAGLNNGNFEIGMSEVDINLQGRPGTQAERWNFQADLGGAALGAVIAVGGKTFQANSANDGVDVWLNQYGGPQSEGTYYDANGNPKPLRDRLLDTLNAEVARQGK